MNSRYEEMLTLYESGVTFKEVGNVFGISRQRVHQILGTRRELHCKRNLYRVIKEHGGWLTQRQIVKAMGYANGKLPALAIGYLKELTAEGKIEMRISAMKYNPYMYRIIE